MDIEQLEYFLNVAKTQNMHTSAEDLHISQPALSRSIKRLEDELGVELFDRHNHSININSYGVLFQRYAESCVNTYKGGKSELQKAIKKAQNKISIMCPVFYLTGILFDAFCGINPNITVEYHTFPYYAIKDALINKDLDLCLTAHPIDDQQIFCMQIRPLTMGILCPKAHRFANRQYISIYELKNEKHISFSKDIQPRMDLEFLCNSKGFYPNVVFESDSFSSLVQMCKKGSGLLMTSKESISYIDTNSLVFVPFDPMDEQVSFKLYLMMRRDSIKVLEKYCIAIRHAFGNDDTYNKKSINSNTVIPSKQD